LLFVLLGYSDRLLGERRGACWHDPAERDNVTTVVNAACADLAGVVRYARWVLAWEALPEAERERRKAERGRQYQREAMATKPPSAAQLGLLRALHYDGPPPATMAEASALIDARRSGRE
jgi:hypothetical protein